MSKNHEVKKMLQNKKTSILSYVIFSADFEFDIQKNLALFF